jgi:hypothetical protein
MRALRGFGLVLLSCVASPALAGSGAFDSSGPFVLDGGDIEAEALAESAAAPPPVRQGPPAPRPVAFEYSDGYYKRLKVHRIASYATLPLFATQVVLGQKLYGNDYSQGTKDAHTAVAIGTATLFAVNSVTGVMNLWEARKDPNAGRRKKVHGILMLASSAGFVATGLLAPDSEGGGDRSAHRAVALTSMGVATVGYLIMLLGN